MRMLSGAQRKYLRGLAHGLKPVIQVGKNGLTEGLVASVDDALSSHELIKVRFVDFKDQKREICEAIDAELGSERVGMIGHVATFFRAAKDPEQRNIRLPS